MSTEFETQNDTNGYGEDDATPRDLRTIVYGATQNGAEINLYIQVEPEDEEAVRAALGRIWNIGLISVKFQ